jgi:hypothetical protein
LKKLHESLLHVKNGKLLKSQLISELIQYKKREMNSQNETHVEEFTPPANKTVTRKSRTVTVPIQQKNVDITQKHGLNLVNYVNKEGFNSEDVVFVLSDDRKLIGYISEESYLNDEDEPHVMTATKRVLLLAKQYGIVYDITDLPDQ